jgi:hypothetical protein
MKYLPSVDHRDRGQTPRRPATMSDEAINLAQKLATFAEHWSPRVVAEMNDNTPGNIVFKLVKCRRLRLAFARGHRRCSRATRRDEMASAIARDCKADA